MEIKLDTKFSSDDQQMASGYGIKMTSEEQRIRDRLAGYFLKNETLLEKAYAEGHAIQILSRQRQRAMGNAIAPILVAIERR